MNSRLHSVCRSSSLVAVLLLSGSWGCDQVPTLPELLGKQEPGDGAVPEQVVQQQADLPEDVPPTVPQAKVPPTPQEVVETFLNTEPRLRTIAQLQELLALDADALQQLTRLELQGSPVNDAGAPLLARFPALQELNLSGTAITNEAMPLVARVPGLQVLTLDRMIIDDRGLEPLADHPQLRELSLVNTPISDAAFRHLARLEGLEVLKVSGTRSLQGHDFDELVKNNVLRNLRVLEASSTGFGYYGLRHINKLSSLEVLRVAEAQVSDQMMPTIAACSNLRELDLRQNLIGDNGLKPLSRLRKLETLRISHCAAVSDSGLNHLRGLKSLRVLDLTGCFCTPGAVRQLKEKHLPETEIHFDNLVL